jgi:hypothetical protein
MRVLDSLMLAGSAIISAWNEALPAESEMNELFEPSMAPASVTTNLYFRSFVTPAHQTV